MTELTWQGKYHDGSPPDNKKVAPVRLALPFQTIETVNETRPVAGTPDMFGQASQQAARASGWYNRLIWGDKKYVLPSLLPEFAGKVNLIYIDPPFDTGANFSFTATVPADPEHESDTTQFVKQPSMLEQKAYRDTWGRGLDSYLQWFYETALLLRELLADDGSIYVHLDWHVGHYAKVIMDEVFGYDRFVNEIVWKRSDAHSDHGQGAKHLGRVHDVIFFYTKSESFTINQLFNPLPQTTVDKWYKNIEDETGRRYNKADVTGPGGAAKGNPVYEWNGITKAWRFNRERMQSLEEQGRLVYSSTGMVYLKRYLDESKGVPLQDWWDDIQMIRGFNSKERLDYATQKPEALLERIIKASSNEGDLVLDCFCGSGTTAATAEKLGRRWITADLGRFAIHTARKRLLGIENVTPFIVQNLGKYERQQWMQAEFAHPEDRLAQLNAYRTFILDLYHANSLSGYAWLHGAKAGRLVHVGGVSSPVTVDDIKASIKEFWQLAGKERSAQTNGIDFLGWDFAFEVNETAQHMAAENKVNIRCLKIPREVLEKKAVEQGDIVFYELAYLDVKVSTKGKTVGLTLHNFVISPDEVPQEVQQGITHWSQWIDYWAVDWNYKGYGDTFHNEWQSYRTKKSPALELQATHTYEATGRYETLVKVIDILGNDTTKVVQITV
jgi:DNA modification methylase